MDILKLGDSKVAFSKDLLTLFKRLTDQYGSRLAALKALRRYAKGEDDGSVAALINDLGIDGDRVKELYNEYKDLLDLLLGNLGDVANRDPVAWPLKADGDANLAGGLLAVSGTAEMEAFLEADVDGQALDDRISFDPDQEVLIRLGVKGKLEGKLNAARNLGSVAGKVGVKADSNALIENYFRHKRSDPVLGALLEDVTDFTLPGLIDDAEDLVAWPSAGTRIPAQWLHLELQGEAAFQGELSWSQSALQTATIANDALNVNDTLTIRTGLEAAVSFSHSISGLFDILVCASEKHRNRLRVELHKSRSTERRLGVEIGATYGISGLDQVGKSILDSFVPQLNEIVGKVEAEVGALPSLRQLFAAKLDEELDEALAKQKVTDEIEAFLATIGKDVDLRAKLKQVLTEAAMKKAGARLDKIDDNIDKLKNDVKKLISNYRKTLAKINKALDKAADIRIGATFAHSRQRSAGRDAFLAFEIDPGAQPKVFRKMILCDFEEALQLAREHSDDIELVDGLLVEKGALRISSQLTLTAAGYSLGHASILDQRWQSEVSLNGDITIAVTGSLTGKLSMLGGRSRTLTFLADSRVVGTIGEASELVDTALTTTASLELSDELKIGKKDMNVMQQRLIEIGVLPANTSLMTELASLSGDEGPSGGLAASAHLALGKDQLACLVNAPIDQGRLVFAMAMNDFVSAGQLAALDSGSQMPVLLWPMVEGFLKEAEKQPSLLDKENWAPVDSQGRPVGSWSRTLTQLLYQRWQYLNAFTNTLNELKSMQGGLQGLDRKQVLEEIRNRQRRLLKASSLLVEGRTLSSKINYVFFKAIFELVKDAGDLDPQVVLEYRKSQSETKRFVLG